MQTKVIGTSVERWDAIAKVKGTAEFTADIAVKNMLYGKILHATIAHGYVKEYDISEALKSPGVIKIILPDDLPNIKFSTAGHPYNPNPITRDKQDRNILTRRVRVYGDDIAAVVAESELEAEIALEKIKVVYEEYPIYLDPEEALKEGAKEIHDGTKNIIADTKASYGDTELGFAKADFIFEDEYSTQIVQHCHMENQVAYAYQDSDQRWACVSSTQIPHICRRILGEAFGMKWSTFRVKKPFIGGGFGNKQDVTIEPIVVAMSMACAGKPVMISLTREESIAYTRVRHAIKYKMKMGINKDGSIEALKVECISNNGGYASHGHAIGGKGGGFIHALYNIKNFDYFAKTVYTNCGTAGAMRGYGIPQVMFALESFMDKAIIKLNLDPIEFRIKNMVPEGSKNVLNNIYQFTNKLDKCLIDGREAFDWDKKKKDSLNYKSGDLRRGVGVASFSYGSGTYPKSFEIAGCRLVLNQDGCIKIMVGATEIGQGSDTVFSQMVAQTVGVPLENVFADAITDTDTAPFDTGAYASRQTYVTGAAVKEAAETLRARILDAVKIFENVDGKHADIRDGNIVYKHNNQLIISLADLAMKTFYNPENAKCITAESSVNLHANSYSMGVTFAEVEVDIKTGKIEILSIINVHDSGTILNPLLASGQVEGGLMMAIGFALSEELKYDKKTGKPLNNNLLDYKFPTMMDIPELGCKFVVEEDPIGPYGNKSLGEPPVCSPAPAIRNAVLNATGVELNHLPMTPQNVFERFKEKGLI